MPTSVVVEPVLTFGLVGGHRPAGEERLIMVAAFLLLNLPWDILSRFFLPDSLLSTDLFAPQDLKP